MRTVIFRMITHGDRWVIEINGEAGTVRYETKEAAFEAICGVASAEMAAGAAIEIHIPATGRA
jgi:hypothetical protein